MKVKTIPEDFRVDELTALLPGKEGDHSLYRLEKNGWSMVDVLGAIRRIWRIEPWRIGYGGLKDRHAITTQFITIQKGPRAGLENPGWRLRHLGLVAEPFTSKHIEANRFQITIRNMPPGTQDGVLSTLEQIGRWGLPNYFDDQRFGSISGPEGAFIAKHLVKGDFEGALKLALGQPYSHDRSSQKKEKAILNRLWGDWDALVRDLPKGHARSLSDYLRVHPGDFKGAVARLRPELRGLYLSAWQSALWNRSLAAWYYAKGSEVTLVDNTSKIGSAPLHIDLSQAALEELRTLQLPLLSARSKPEEVEPTRWLWQPILEAEGVTLEELKVPGLRELFFSRGLRPALLEPAHLNHEFLEDELHKGKQKLLLRYELGRGSYATMLVKRVQRGVEAANKIG